MRDGLARSGLPHVCLSELFPGKLAASSPGAQHALRLSGPLQAFETMGAGGWCLFVFGYLGMLGCLFGLHRLDEQRLHKGFMPRWHRLLARRQKGGYAQCAQRIGGCCSC